MKKLMMAAGLFALVSSASAGDFFWSTWFRDDLKDKEVKGCVLGLAAEVDKAMGAEVNVCISKANTFDKGAQVAWGYCRAEKLSNGVQAAFWCEADSAALQLGLICHNKTGFLPWFPFFNFDSKMFGSKK